MPESFHTIRLKNLQDQGIDLPESNVRQDNATTSKPEEHAGGLPQAAEPDVDEDTQPGTAVQDQVDLERAGCENLLDATSADE